MLLSIPTLLMVAVFIFGLMGLLTLHAWSRGVREQTLGYLGSMLILAALGATLVSLRGQAPDFISLVLGNIVLLLGAALNWTAMRVFGGRPAHLPGIFAGALFWSLAFTPCAASPTKAYPWSMRLPALATARFFSLSCCSNRCFTPSASPMSPWPWCANAPS
ncbi:hypothetical protein [Pseudomonas fluorescens]|uniref:hypothetical protein n=1 Tax=Pseudomonas fluorescens TaxID=294 RepID=UPI00292A5B7A|nr:hypothetical protein [Pseudomonas fluorescens]